MKRAAVLFLILSVFPLYIFSQDISDIDYISPYNDGVSAIKKGNQWAFINNQGEVVVDFRNDFSFKNDYPVFNNDRALIYKKKEGISYFGYIDKSGKTVIEPQFLNATDFNNDLAIAIELVKEEVGKNELLNKEVYKHKYFEVVIDKNGEIIKYLTTEPVHITLDKSFIPKPIKIKSKYLSNRLFAVKGENEKWMIKKVK